IGSSGSRIVDVDWISFRICNAAKIEESSLIGGRISKAAKWDRLRISAVRRLHLSGRLPITKEEELVFLDGSAERRAELVEDIQRNSECSWVEVVQRGKRAAGIEVVSSALSWVCGGLCLLGDACALGLALLGIGGVGDRVGGVK